MQRQTESSEANSLIYQVNILGAVENTLIQNSNICLNSNYERKILLLQYRSELNTWCIHFHFRRQKRDSSVRRWERNCHGNKKFSFLKRKMTTDGTVFTIKKSSLVVSKENPLKSHELHKTQPATSAMDSEENCYQCTQTRKVGVLPTNEPNELPTIKLEFQTSFSSCLFIGSCFQNTCRYNSSISACNIQLQTITLA